MKRMLLAVAATIGLTAMAMAGDHPVQGVVTGGPGCTSCGSSGVAPPGYDAPAMPAGECGCPVCEKEKRFGLNPLFKRLMFWKKDNPCGTGCLRGRFAGCLRGNCGAGDPAPGIGYPGTPGAQMPGTLVFPQHPYVRSPRDWFEK